MTALLSRRAAGTALAGALFLTASATIALAQAAAPDLGGVTIVVGQQGSETEGIFVESGVFKDAPYKVEFASFAGPVDTLAALASGRVDVANNVAQWTATQASASAQTPWTRETAPYRNALVTGPGNVEKFERFVAAASAQSKITSIAETKGKKWGIIRGASGHLFAAKILEKQGWTFDDIETVNIDATNQALAIQSGSVDVVFNPRDNLLQALSRGAKVIGESYQYDATIYTGYLMNVKALDDPRKGAGLKDFAARVIRALDWYNRNPDLAQKALVKYRKLTPEQAKVVWEYTRVRPLPADSVAAYSQSLADTAFTFKLINKKVDAAALLDNRFDDVIRSTTAAIRYEDNLKASYAGN